MYEFYLMHSRWRPKAGFCENGNESLGSIKASGFFISYISSFEGHHCTVALVQVGVLNCAMTNTTTFSVRLISLEDVRCKQ
jgi:hypothetical protein